jgi:hypothetical protein
MVIELFWSFVLEKALLYLTLNLADTYTEKELNYYCC